MMCSALFSTISLRSAGQGKAMSVARSNARLALMLAIGDLQKTAGPDQRVTARADVIDENITNPRLTGVWKSRRIDGAALPTPADYQKSERDEAFLGWLTSSVDGKAAAQIGHAAIATAAPVTLWGKGSLGNNANAKDIVTASKVPTSPTRGALAWAVMDEGVKVRVNTAYSDKAETPGMKTAQLGAGEAPNTGWIPKLGGLKRAFFEKDAEEYKHVAKGISRMTFGLARDGHRGLSEELPGWRDLRGEFLSQGHPLHHRRAQGHAPCRRLTWLRDAAEA